MDNVRTPCVCWVFVATALVVMSRSAAGQSDFSAVKAEVVAAQARHASRAENVQFDSIEEHYDELNSHALVSKVRTRARRNGQCYLVEAIVDVTPPSGLKGLMPRRNSQVLARNSHYGFELSRPGGPNEWSLKEVHLADSAAPSPRFLETESLARDTLFVRPYAINASTLLADLFNATSFRLLGCAPSTSDPALVRVQFEHAQTRAGKKPPTKSTGWCDLDPSVGWSIRASEVTTDDEVLKVMVRRDLASTVDGDGLVRIEEERIEVRIMKGKALLAQRTQNTKYKVGVDHDVPERVFSLTAYGMPEPPGISFSQPTPMYVWFLLATGSLGALAIVFRRLAHRRAATKVPV